MYPAIEMGAGEKKEAQGDFNSTTNISSAEIIIAKMFSITLSAVITAVFSTLGFIIPLANSVFIGDSIQKHFLI